MPSTKPTEARKRFVRAANTRVNNALVEIQKIGKLHTDRYEYGSEDIASIMGALQSAVDEVQENLEGRAKPDTRITVIAE